jgi:enamine deaminase RidA (YjgF/YER057c/UK114 family)
VSKVKRTIDSVYREFFSAPYPNRSSAAVAGLVVPGMKLEIVAYAVIANQASSLSIAAAGAKHGLDAQ